MPSTIAWRASALDRFRHGQFDLLVIGGGINGAGIARDAALRGLSVALVERDDFASGTSSRSSRLVHGGVRYLEHAFLHLVFEASRERRTLLRIAPDLVHPLHFTWPVYTGSRIPRWKLGAGLWLYDVLALFRNVGRHKRLGRDGILAIEPSLEHDRLLGGATYWDAATDDSRLTLANVVDASRAGATVLNYAEVTGLLFDGTAVSGATVHDRINGGTTAIRARAVMNATGPWTDAIRRFENPAERPAVLGTKGVHISVPADRVGNHGALIVLAPQDGREMFVLPAGSHTIIGTTDAPTNEHPDQVRASRADVQYLIDSVNRYFPDAKLTIGDVIAAWAGIRPLIASGNGGDPATASREDEIVTGPGGLISVSGGKLTTYRSMSERIVDVIQHQLGLPVTPSQTGVLMLAAPANEFACTVADVLVRRTKRAFDFRDHGLSEAPRVAAALAAEHGWSAADLSGALDDYRSEIARLFTIEP
jgi:glycerol-3-phosphate dehydrogenase